MPFESQKFKAVTTHGELGGVILGVTSALSAAAHALRALKAGADPQSDIDTLQSELERLDKMFDDLTGYTPEK